MSSEDQSVKNDVMCARLTAHLREPPPPPQVPVYALPDQFYLEATVLPLLLRALEEVVKARPPDPLAFLAAYLLSNNPQRGSHPLLGDDGRRVPLHKVSQLAAEIMSRAPHTNIQTAKP